MTTPQRKEQPKPHLDASLIPLEQALRHRADELANSPQIRIRLRQVGLNPGHADTVGRALAAFVAAEFRAIADELHYW